MTAPIDLDQLRRWGAKISDADRAKIAADGPGPVFLCDDALAARLAAADALVGALLDFPTVHLEQIYDLAEAYRATEGKP